MSNSPSLTVFSLMSIIISQDIETPEFDDALGSLQRLLGVKTGDLAGVVFSDTTAWSDATPSRRWSILFDYIAQEIKLAGPDPASDA